MASGRRASSTPRYGRFTPSGLRACSDLHRSSDQPTHRAKRGIFERENSTLAGPINARKPLSSADRTVVALLFSPRPRHPCRAGPPFHSALSSRNVSASAEGIGDMQQLNSLLRSAPSRVGRRLALIFAIWAASLPAGGGEAGPAEPFWDSDQAASDTRISTCKPAAPIILIRVSRPNSSILPRMRSEIRGCVTPSSLAGFARV